MAGGAIRRGLATVVAPEADARGARDAARPGRDHRRALVSLDRPVGAGAAAPVCRVAEDAGPLLRQGVRLALPVHGEVVLAPEDAAGRRGGGERGGEQGNGEPPHERSPRSS